MVLRTPHDRCRRPLARSIRLLLIAAALASFAWNLKVSIWDPFHHEARDWGDFGAYYMAGYCVAGHIPIYDHDRVVKAARALRMGKNRSGAPRFGYPPLTALLFSPLARCFDPVHALRIVLIFYQILLWISVWLLVRAFHVRLTLEGGALVVMAVSWFTPAWNTMQSGQINMVILVLICLGILAWTRVKPFLSGVFFAVAAAIKIFPGIVVLYFALRRRRRSLGGMLFAGAVLAGITLSVLGYGVHRRYLTEEVPRYAKRIHAGNFNVALNGFVYRTLHPVQRNDRILAESRKGWWATLTGRILFLLAAAGLLVFPRRDGIEPGLLRLCLLLTTAMLINAWTWTHHLVAALPCLAAAGRSHRFGRAPVWRPSGILLLLAYGMMAISYRVPLYDGPPGLTTELLRSSSLNFYGLLILWCLLAAGIVKGRNPESSPCRPSPAKLDRANEG